MDIKQVFLTTGRSLVAIAAGHCLNHCCRGLVSRYINRFSGASFKSFKTLAKAQESWTTYLEGEQAARPQFPAGPTPPTRAPHTATNRASSAPANRGQAGSVTSTPASHVRAGSVTPVPASRVQAGSVSPVPANRAQAGGVATPAPANRTQSSGFTPVPVNHTQASSNVLHARAANSPVPTNASIRAGDDQWERRSIFTPRTSQSYYQIPMPIVIENICPPVQPAALNEVEAFYWVLLQGENPGVYRNM